MRALLVNPWIHDFAAYDLWSKPLGLLRIASCLKRLDVEVRLIDCLDRFHPRLVAFLQGKLPRATVFGNGHYYAEAIEKPRIFRSLPRIFKRYGFPPQLFQTLVREEPKPDIILVGSGMTYWYPGVCEAIQILRQRFGAVPILLGGIYARLCPVHARAHSGADVVYSGSRLSEIAGLISQLTERPLSYVSDEDTVDSFAYDLYPKLHYAALRTSSGCPFRCSYCGWYILEPEFRQDEPHSIAEQILDLCQSRGIKNFSFYDDALLYNAERHIVVILKEMLARKMEVNFHTPNGLHVRFITPALARLLKEAGFIKPRLGFETASGRRQQHTGAKATNEEFLQAVRYLRDAGYKAGEIAVNIMMGLPQQDIKEIEGSIEFVGPTGCRICLEEYSPVPGTPDFLRSGLSIDSDPLVHNNSAFTLYHPDEYQRFQVLKELVHKWNSRPIV